MAEVLYGGAYKRRKLGAHARRSLYGFVTAAIPLVGYLLFNLVPLGIAVVTMFVDMDGYNFGSMQWNNFANFKTVFTDARFLHSLGVSFILTVPHMLGLIISLCLSALLAQKLAGHKFFKALYFVPYICSSVAIAVMWRWIFDQNIGIFNDIIKRLTHAESGPQWFSDAGSFTAMLITVMVWQAPGYGIVMFAAAFTNINPALYEAADIDGAGALRKFRSVTLPAISPTVFYLLMAGIIAGLQTFDIPQIFAGDSWTGEAGPNDAALSSVLYIYYKGVMFSEMPVASVMSMTLFVVIFVIMVINFKLSQKWVSYDV
ncbi:MAG: sugar ABC transporter permease [Clostridia bacterium]|nr:sugar ABC transporter permease [Clostridia bacterium]